MGHTALRFTLGGTRAASAPFAARERELRQSAARLFFSLPPLSKLELKAPCTLR